MLWAISNAPGRLSERLLLCSWAARTRFVVNAEALRVAAASGQPKTGLRQDPVHVVLSGFCTVEQLPEVRPSAGGVDASVLGLRAARFGRSGC